MPVKNSVTCLCGSVTICAEIKDPKYCVCHCSSCQTWSGGPLLMAHCGSDVELKGEAFVREYASSAWATRAFCTECGTHLFSRLTADNSYNVPVGLLASELPLKMDMQYFIDQKPNHYCFSNTTKTMTKSEVFAHFQSESPIEMHANKDSQ
ncbi:GFA family protein [Vibrio sp. JPW-9-11-11]|uniref:GFA family protein n=1 Tax=Vibrio sp. JPW-9-11-11 TaxID=1416532 RepID=UPI0015936A84|nr:GFA family protein [Vibrio sp. JPW-9-11-11]NVD06492.1 GFA family protein [Vibrio sp. JPW-9-11-11]